MSISQRSPAEFQKDAERWFLCDFLLTSVGEKITFSEGDASSDRRAVGEQSRLLGVGPVTVGG